MAISADRLLQLQQEFVPVKNKIDQIDRKYSLDYNEPLLDMPESLDLPKLEYTPKSESELRAIADEQTYASYLAETRRLQKSNALNIAGIDKRIANSEEKTRAKIALLLQSLNERNKDIQTKMTNCGMLFSTVFSRIKAEAESDS